MARVFDSLSSAQRLGVEVLFLVLAVLFALAVDEAWEDHENNEAAAKAMSRIYQELQRNKDRILDGNKAHKLELERLQPVMAQMIDAESSPPEDFDSNVNIQISILRDTAWRSAQLADLLRHVSYEKVERVTAAYSIQELYLQQTWLAMSFQSDVNFIQAASAVQLRSTFIFLSELHNIENMLLSAYGQVEVEAGAEPVVQ